MGNAHSVNVGGGGGPAGGGSTSSVNSRLTKSHSQECLDPIIIERAMASAAAPPRRGRRPTKTTGRRTSVKKTGDDGKTMMDDNHSSKRHLGVEMERRSSQRQLWATAATTAAMLDYSDVTMNDGSSSHSFLLGNSSHRRQSRRISTQDFADSISNLTPQEVLRQLEDFASDGMDGADEYLHTLKNINE